MAIIAVSGYSVGMFRSNTVFVVGAGASKEAGLPVGSELTEKIATLLDMKTELGDITNGDRVIYQALERLARQGEWSQNRFVASARDVANAMDLAQSIDTFLESHSGNREYVQLGKLGIVRAIAQAETSSKLQPTDYGRLAFKMKNLADTWYYSLARQLFTGVPADKPHRAFIGISFIVFNYDRCLQTFLTRAAQVYFRLSPAAAEELISRVDFIHPYGSLGSIFGHGDDRLPFAALDFDLIAAASRIRTFSESCDVADSIRQKVDDAETVIFLGFGFHEQNIAVLDISQNFNIHEANPKRVFATTMHMSASDEAVVRSQISYAIYGRGLNEHKEPSIFTNNGSCADLFSTYWRSLTA